METSATYVLRLVMDAADLLDPALAVGLTVEASNDPGQSPAPDSWFLLAGSGLQQMGLPLKPGMTERRPPELRYQASTPPPRFVRAVLQQTQRARVGADLGTI